MFITLEGPDGSGKSTQLPRLVEFLRARGYEVVPTREPGGTDICNEIRQTLFNWRSEGMNARTEVLLFLASRAQLVEQVIRPAVQAGKVVVSDRYSDSTLAYQGYGNGGDLDTLRQLLRYTTGGLQPDLTILFDIDPVEGIRRRSSGGGEWNYLDANPAEYHQRVRQGYLELAAADPGRWVTLDAGRPRDAIQADLCRLVLARLEQAGVKPVQPSKAGPAQ